MNLKKRKKGVFRLVVSSLLVAVMFLTTAMAADDQKAGNQQEYYLKIDVKKSVAIKGDTILLKDIAEIAGTPVLQEKAGAIRINAAPRPGEDTAIAGSRIVSIVRAKRWIPGQTRIVTPSYVFVSRLSQILSESLLQKQFAAYVKEKAGGSRLEIVDFKIIGHTVFPAGDLAFDFPEYDRPIMKRVSLGVDVVVDGNPFGSVTLSAWVDRYEPVVTVRHRMRRGEVLAAADLCMMEINVAKAPSNIVTAETYAAGKQLACDLMAGDYLRDNMLSVPYLIHKGDRIKIIAENRFLKVITTGIARDDGRQNDQIKVENINSGQVIAARVADASSVRVSF